MKWIGAIGGWLGFAAVAAVVGVCAWASPARADGAAPAGVKVIDGFDDPSSWKVVTADGVTLKTRSEEGKVGKCLRIDYDFARGSGYGLVRKELKVGLPANYRFSYWVRGDGPRNTLEFKLVDPSGDNVWWVNQRNTEFPREWTAVSLPRRKFSFAWGPSGGKPIVEARWIEIAITSANGGKGTVWLDELGFEQLPESVPYAGMPRLTASSGELLMGVMATDGSVGWTSAPIDREPKLTVDFGTPREFGGLTMEWAQAAAPKDYRIDISSDGEAWSALTVVKGSNGGRDYLQTPDTATRFLRVVCTDVQGHVGLSRIRFMPLEFADSSNAMLSVVARGSLHGWYPRYFWGEATYWTVVGASGDEDEALVNEDGQVEVNKLAFSLEPFAMVNGKFETWADCESDHSLVNGSLPIPSVTRHGGDIKLETKAFVEGQAGSSRLIVRYQLTNLGPASHEGTLAIAIRPFQVNPPYQNLNISGGASTIHTIKRSAEGAGEVLVDDRVVIPLVKPDKFGATTFDGGEIVEHLAIDQFPKASEVDDPRGLASAALGYSFALKAGQSRTVAVMVPFHPGQRSGNQGDTPGFGDARGADGIAFADKRLQESTDWWREQLGRVKILLPKGNERITDSIRANLAYILINRDGPAIQPGSRCYERTWIRDGCLTSTALLALGHESEVREFLDWFAPFQYENGKIPCCVDKRGPDPVPENDSHGEYIYAVGKYYQFTRDEAFVKRHWPHVVNAVKYIEFLRAQRMTEEYRSGPSEKRVCYGLMPESISHEGYSAKPMHSYWDDLWTLKGLTDAASLAETVGDSANAAKFAAMRDDFRRTLIDSMNLAMQSKGINFIPGCAELGDFDATSTTVALFPCGQRGTLPDPALTNTFQKYWEFFKERRDGKAKWRDYTPYENRIVGSMILLGERERAHELMDFFFKGQRPPEWREWAEVVRRDDREQGYIGDMPHTWVGSDFINSMVLMLAYPRESDGAMVIGAGLTRGWVESEEGVHVEGLRTAYGPLNYSVHKRDGAVAYEIEKLERVPAGGVLVSLPDAQACGEASVGGAAVHPDAAGLVNVGTLPATLVVRYKQGATP